MHTHITVNTHLLYPEKAANILADVNEQLADIIGMEDLKTQFSVSKHSEIPGWNHVKARVGLPLNGREMFLTLESYGKLRTGVVFENMTLSRARFKHAVRFCQRMEEATKASLGSKFKSCSKEVKSPLFQSLSANLYC